MYLCNYQKDEKIFFKWQKEQKIKQQYINLIKRYESFHSRLLFNQLYNNTLDYALKLERTTDFENEKTITSRTLNNKIEKFS